MRDEDKGVSYPDIVASQTHKTTPSDHTSIYKKESFVMDKSLYDQEEILRAFYRSTQMDPSKKGSFFEGTPGNFKRTFHRLPNHLMLQSILSSRRKEKSKAAPIKKHSEPLSLISSTAVGAMPKH